MCATQERTDGYVTYVTLISVIDVPISLIVWMKLCKVSFSVYLYKLNEMNMRDILDDDEENIDNFIREKKAKARAKATLCE